ncbi:MAG: PolC-type DNA polymerase III [Clostridiales bacterium]|nr:PolC-type DNA polymerase III [Clostridiales bacterium]
MNTPFFELFDAYRPSEPGALEQLRLGPVKLDRARRHMEVTLLSGAPLDRAEMEAHARQLEALYALERLTFRFRYEGVALCEEHLPYLSDCLDLLCQSCRGFLRDAGFALEGDRLTLALAHGGGEALERAGAADKLAALLREEFGLRLAVRFVGRTGLDDFSQQVSPQVAEIEAQGRALAQQAGAAAARGARKARGTGGLLYGRRIAGKTTPICEVTLESGRVTVCGEVFNLEVRQAKDGQMAIVSFCLTDQSSSVACKLFPQADRAAPLLRELREGLYVRLRGDVRFDSYGNQPVVMAADIQAEDRPVRMDEAEEKRVELHLHTTMSQMDAVTPVERYIERAARWGHEAIAITDHGVIQAFPDAAAAAGKLGYKGKLLYGMEGYLIHEEPGEQGIGACPLDGDFVVFDVETTGLSAHRGRLTEIGAVRISAGQARQRFQTFVNPGMPIPEEITRLTGITDEMVRDAPGEAQAVQAFLDFAGEDILVAHNAAFDMGFVGAAATRAGLPFLNPSIDTVGLARRCLPDLRSHKLNVLAEHFGVSFRHHRADDDSMALAEIFLRMLEMARAQGACRVADLETVFGDRRDLRAARTCHITLLVKNQVGLKNLYKLVSKSSLEYFGNKRPKLPRRELMKHREGLILGSACQAGELFSALVDGAPREQLLEIAAFYDYLEIQPIANNRFLIDRGLVEGEEQLRDLNRRVVELGEALQKPVVATGDAHFLDPQEEIFRAILLAGQGYEDADRPTPLYLRTTQEMLEEFAYLGEDKAREVVVENTRLVASWCEPVNPLRKGMFPPEIEGADRELRDIATARAKALYGDPLPPIVAERLERELAPIIGNGYAVLYVIARRIVLNSLENGYLVGSRGSVGSSVAAYFAGITEVNALPPHYRCAHCRYVQFDLSETYEAGCDMPDLCCPACGARCAKDGFDIPFETFMGFAGEKVPDIDLNFSGEYQSAAHRFAEQLFGEGHVFRAGTIATVADKTAYGYVKKYLEERGREVSRAEEQRLIAGCTGVKRTTGQHPGGIMVVPHNMEIEDFSPVQHPADDRDKGVVTTHFDYHAIHDNILKLDLLGHDDPTILRMLGDLTGVEVTGLPLDDPKVLSLFSSPEALALRPGADLGPVGAIAIPEFGTKFVRGMLEQTRPTTVAELVRISGLSHGTDVWLGNAERLIREGVATLREVICCRDDIMRYLIQMGLPKEQSFEIMEQVRKGRGLSPEQEARMRAQGVPDWYVESCKLIQYMFPRAHAVAYVTMAIRVAWFKVYHPLAFYAAYFSIRAGDFDANEMTGDRTALLKLLRQVEKIKDPTAKDRDRAVVAEVCLEMAERGYGFLPVDLYASDPSRFVIEEGRLRPPLQALPGVGETAAKSIAAARAEGAFLSQQELVQRARISKAVLESLQGCGALGDLPESAQLAFF